MPTLVDRSRLTATELDGYRERVFVVLRGVFTECEMAALSVEADRLLEERRDLIDPGNLRCRYMLDAEIVTVSHHLGILKHADIVEARREGRFMIYRLRDDLLQKAGGTNAKQFLNLGCCRLEIPKEG